MTYSPILLVHIAGGSVGIISGMTAMFLRKGSPLHRQVGNVFFYAMIIMTMSATYLAIFVEPSKINTTIALFTCYLVLTARRTALNRKGESGVFERVGLFSILVILGAFILFSIQVSNTEQGYFDDGIPAPAYYMFTIFAALAFILDLKVVYRGSVNGAQRIARHLWRMCLALYIATASFFLGQPQVFPEALSSPLLRSVPVILVIVMLFFWLIRVYVIRRFKLPR